MNLSDDASHLVVTTLPLPEIIDEMARLFHVINVFTYYYLVQLLGFDTFHHERHSRYGSLEVFLVAKQYESDDCLSWYSSRYILDLLTSLNFIQQFTSLILIVSQNTLDRRCVDLT